MMESDGRDDATPRRSTERRSTTSADASTSVPVHAHADAIVQTAGTPAEPPAEPTAAGALTRLHPSSPIFGIARHARALIVPALIVLVASRGGWASWEAWAAILILPLAIYEFVRYATTRYRVDGDRIEVVQGLVFRSERKIPLRRIQNLDLVQNVFHRMLGVAEVQVSTAGSAEPEAVFKVLSLDAVARLRQQVLPGSSGDAASSTGVGGGGVGADEAIVGAGDPLEPLSGSPSTVGSFPEPGDAPGAAASSRNEVMLRIPTSELILLGLLSDRGMALVAVGFGVAWETGVLNRIGFSSLYHQYGAGLAGWTLVFAAAALLVSAFLVLRVLSALWMVLRFHDFTLERDGTDLRIRCGLLTRITATIPARRIQLVSVRQTPLQRALGRLSIRVETAGGVTGNDHAGDAALLGRRWFVPILPSAELSRILDVVRPALGVEFGAAPWQPATPAARRRIMRRSMIASSLVALAALAVAGGLSMGGLFTGGTLVVIAIATLGVLVVPWSLWLAAREARFLAHALTDDGVLFRSGAWTRQRSATFVDKIQVVALVESPFDRRHAMATLAVDTAGVGPAEHAIQVPFLPRAEAEEMLATLATRADAAAFRW